VPEPEDKKQDKKEKPSPKSQWVEAEKLVQLGFMFPAAIFLGWAAGWMLDHWLHTNWIKIVGLIFGMIVPIVKLLQVGLDPKNQG
jgi:F0F1-type ATP synthase assembly protein I